MLKSMVDSHIGQANYILHRQMPALERYTWQTPLAAREGRISVYLEESRGGGCEVGGHMDTDVCCEEAVKSGMMVGRKEVGEMCEAVGRSIEGEMGMHEA